MSKTVPVGRIPKQTRSTGKINNNKGYEKIYC